MNVFAVGVGDAFSSKHWGTSFLVTHDDFTLAIDCPDSYLRALKGHGRAPEEIDAIFITHLHGDHVNGLEMLLAWSTFVSRRKLDIYTTPEAARDLWERRLQASLGVMYDGVSHRNTSLDEFANLHVVPWNETFKIGPFEVITRPTNHHLPASAMRLSAQGKTWAYSCDTAFDPELIDWLRDADLVFHEASYGPAHSPLEKLEELPEELRKKLKIVHLPDTLETSKFLNFAKEGQTYGLF